MLNDTPPFLSQGMSYEQMLEHHFGESDYDLSGRLEAAEWLEYLHKNKTYHSDAERDAVDKQRSVVGWARNSMQSISYSNMRPISDTGDFNQFCLIRLLCLDALVEEGDQDEDYRLNFKEFSRLMADDFVPSNKRELEHIGGCLT